MRRQVAFEMTRRDVPYVAACGTWLIYWCVILNLCLFGMTDLQRLSDQPITDLWAELMNECTGIYLCRVLWGPSVLLQVLAVLCLLFSITMRFHHGRSSLLVDPGDCEEASARCWLSIADYRTSSLLSTFAQGAAGLKTQSGRLCVLRKS